MRVTPEESTPPVVIFAGGVGSRLGEHTNTVPKPLVSVGNVPIIYRIMKSYSDFGFDRFVILGGYLFDALKQKIVLDAQGIGDVKVDFATGVIKNLSRGNFNPNWQVTLVNTGLNSETSLRLMLARSFLEDDRRFFLTYGDGLANLDFQAQLHHHIKSEKMATLTAVQTPSKYGHLHIKDGATVGGFAEKPIDDSSWINGGFFVMETKVLDHLEALGNAPLEEGLLPQLATRGELGAYLHKGFWKSMDTPKDKVEFDRLAFNGELPSGLNW